MSNKAPLICPESIASLRELSEPGKDFYAEMANLYLQQAPAKVKDMEAKLGQRNFTGISAIAHQLKSSSGNLGAMSLADLFVKVEESAKHKDIENLLRVFPELKKTFAEVCTALAELASGNVKKAA
jgi:HPt (histidine-containing phosphotransfer) domain-containing protein